MFIIIFYEKKSETKNSTVFICEFLPKLDLFAGTIGPRGWLGAAGVNAGQLCVKWRPGSYNWDISIMLTFIIQGQGHGWVQSSKSHFSPSIHRYIFFSWHVNQPNHSYNKSNGVLPPQIGNIRPKCSLQNFSKITPCEKDDWEDMSAVTR